MRQVPILLFFSCSVAALCAPPVTFGVTGGIPATDALRWQKYEGPRYVVGPSVELQLPAGFAVEFDALYRRIGGTSLYLSLNPGVTSFSAIRQRGNSWEFPVLGKYYFRRKSDGWRPFVSTGYAFRKTWWENEVASLMSGEPLSYQFSSDSPLEAGVVIGAGVRWKFRRVLLAPELRYSRWSGGSSTMPNQVGALLGVRF